MGRLHYSIQGYNRISFFQIHIVEARGFKTQLMCLQGCSVLEVALYCIFTVLFTYMTFLRRCTMTTALRYFLSNIFLIYKTLNVNFNLLVLFLKEDF